MRKRDGYMWAVGGMDVCTGVLLVFAPELTLGLMGLHHLPQEPVFLSWIGVFVFAIGAAYWLPYIKRELQQEQLSFALGFTAMARVCVGLFVGSRILANQLESGWITVALVDLACAAVQFWMLKEGDL